MKKYTIHAGFTLIELIVSIAIFGLIMISVMAIFLFSSQMSTRVELNRLMQENVKNVLEDIAESVRKNGIIGARDYLGTCKLPSPTGVIPVIKFVEGIALCSGSNQYIIGSKNADGSFSPVSNMVSYCGDLKNTCYILKNDGGATYFPLTNSFVSFEDINFIISNGDMPKVTVSMTLRPAVKKGMASALLDANTIQVQTTLSERLIETK